MILFLEIENEKNERMKEIKVMLRKIKRNELVAEIIDAEFITNSISISDFIYAAELNGAIKLLHLKQP